MAEGFPSIPQFFAGREVFITGASGFMGKVLVERLLSACPEVRRLHLLLRTKRGLTPEARLNVIKDSPVFDVVRKRCPEQLGKLRAVPGDITLPRVGVTDRCLEEMKEVSVVFNCAATVRFGETLRRSLDQNTLSVMKLLDLADRLPNILVFVHMSTAYANSEHATVEERVYPLPSALPDMIRDALALPDDADPQDVKRLISPKPNTYAYTKMMGEAVVEAHGGGRYARAIFRPTIVISSIQHPFPGWVEGRGGVSGPACLAAQGALHVIPSSARARADLLPVDRAIDALLAVAWDTALTNSSSVRVYNCSTCANPTTWGELTRCTVESARRDPDPNALWYPSVVFVSNRLLFALLSFLAQTVPLHALEHLTRFFTPSKRFNFIKLSDSVRATNDALLYYMTREWVFPTERLRELRGRMCERDRDTFRLDPESIDWNDCYAKFYRGCRRHLGGHRDDTLPAARRRLRRLHLLHRGLTLVLPLLVVGRVCACAAGYWTLALT